MASEHQAWDRPAQCIFQQLPSHALTRRLMHCALVRGVGGLGGRWQGAFTFATFWPPSRFPVFIMGVLAGLLRVRDPNPNPNFSPNATASDV